MVEIPDIKDEVSLRAWLEDQPREVSIWIAARASARVLPGVWHFLLTARDPPVEGKLAALPFCRRLLISSVAAFRPTEDIKNAAEAANASGWVSPSDYTDAVYLAAQPVTAETAVAAASAANVTATTADTQASTASDFWESIRTDADQVAEGTIPDALPLWHDGPFVDQWTQIKAQVADDPDADDWRFWIDWYDALLEGRTMLSDPVCTWDMLEQIATEITPETWDSGPVIPRIREIWDEYEGTALSDAAIVDFDFNAALQQMDVVGFDDDLAHLKDPDAVAAFVDDIDELQDGLQDFLDFSEQERRNSNALPMLGRAAEKILTELRRTQDKTHIRARRLVVLGGYLYSFSLEEDKRDELGDTLTNMLDRNVGLLQSTCKKHLASSLARLEPLSTLERGDNAPDDMLATMRQALDTLRAADGRDMARLSPEGRAILGEMVSELEELVAAADAASTPERREKLLARFTRGYGGVSATFRRYVEKARPHAEKANSLLDKSMKYKRRWTWMSDILEFLDNLWQNIPPSS